MNIAERVSQKKEVVRFLRFGVVGTIGAVVDFTVFNLCLSLLQLQPLAAQAISFSLAVVSNFILNRIWTFPDSRSKPVMQQLTQYIFVNFMGLLIRTGAMAAIVPWAIQLMEKINLTVGIPAQKIGANLALAIVIGIVLFWNFFVNRYWTYNDIE